MKNLTWFAKNFPFIHEVIRGRNKTLKKRVTRSDDQVTKITVVAKYL